jgi:phage shock protein A
MGIMTRLTRLFKADLHGMIDRLEDQELLIRHYLREMESSLQQKKHRLELMNRTQHKLEASLANRRQEADKLEHDLTLALRKEKDEIARMLIRKQRLQQRQKEHLFKQLDALRQKQRSLAKILEEQRVRYETLKVKAASAGHAGQQGPHRAEVGDAPELGSTFALADEEIELELIRRKEELLQDNGGEA